MEPTLPDEMVTVADTLAALSTERQPQTKHHPRLTGSLPCSAYFPATLEIVSDDLKLAAAFGPDQPQRFLTAWLGPPSRDAPESTASDLPAALTEWHRQVGRWDSPVMRQNRVPAHRRMDGDVLLVGLENQGVWLWGVRDEGDNPLVWERESKQGANWTETGERLDEFLWHFTLVDAVCGTRFGLAANDVNSIDLARLTSTWTALNVKPWRWPSPRHTMWVWEGLLAWTMVNNRHSPVTEASTYSIFVGARSNLDLVHVDDSNIAWDRDSRSDQ
jgi:hypothetical protein